MGYYVSSGVTSTGIVLSNDYMYVLSGGMANSTTVNYSGSVCVSSGGVVNNTTVNYLGNLIISSGGVVNNTTVNYLGNLIISSGGVVNDTAVNASGNMNVSCGGLANSITLISGGSLTISDFGTANSTIVDKGGCMTVFSGGTATNVIWTPCEGKVWTETGAYITYASAYSGVYFGLNDRLVSHAAVVISKAVTSSFMYVMDAGMAINTAVDRGWMYISSGGIVDLTSIRGASSNGGIMAVFGGGLANNTSVNFSGYLFISSGGIASNTTLNNLGCLTVYSGGMANVITVNNGGFLAISSGGNANSITMNGGVAYVYEGMVNNATLNAGGIYVSSGGVVDNIIANGYHSNNTYGGFLEIASGGVASNTTVNSLLTVSNGGVASNTIVNSGGWLNICSGGMHCGTLKIISGADFWATSGVRIDFTVADRTIENDYLVNDLSLISGTPTYTITVSANQATGIYKLAQGAENFTGSISISNGTTNFGSLVANRNDICFNSRLYQLDLADGNLTLMVSERESNPVKIFSSGMQISRGVYVSGVDLIYSGTNSMTIASGGVADRTTVSGMPKQGGVMTVFSGGLANNTTVNFSGYLFCSSGGSVSNTTLNNLGCLAVYSGGVAACTTMNNGGFLAISSGGVVNSITMNGGAMYVYDGMVNDATVRGGEIYVYNGGVVAYTTMNNGGFLTISSGGVANSTTVKNVGHLVVSNGGVANDITVNYNGRLTISSGGTITGKLQIEFGAWVSMEPGAIINFDLMGRTSASDALINNLSLVSGVPTYTITMADTQISGDYKLAEGVLNFDQNITISNQSGATGVVSVNSSVKLGASTCSLNLNDAGLLSLSVITEDITPPSAPVASADITAPTNQDVTVSATFSSDSVQKQYSRDGENWLAYTTSIVMSSNGSVYFRGIDAAGNISDITSYAVSNIDKVAPVITLVGDTQSAVYETSLTATVDDGSKLYYRIGDSAWLEYTAPITVSANAIYGFKATDAAGNIGTTSIEFSNILSKAPTNLVGSKDALSWGTTGASRYVVEYSTDNFEHTIKLTTTKTGLDSLDLPAGTYQWRVRSEDNDQWTQGESIISDNTSTVPKVISSTANGNGDVFFATANGTWTSGYAAKHVGSIGDWDGTNELVSTTGKNRLYNLFFGSTDSNILLLTDDANGDAIFVDDIYTELPGTVSQQQSRIARIQEIRAGVGDDIVDMTSQRFEYIGDGLTIRGGDGNDTLWANKGDNMLFGDVGNDRLVGASGNDVIAGGNGNDRMHGGGGSDIFAFCDNWGADTVEQLSDGDVTLWFESGSLDNWDASTLTYTDGTSSVKVSGVTADKVSLKFGDDGSEQYASLAVNGAFADFSSEKIFEDKNKGILATI